MSVNCPKCLEINKLEKELDGYAVNLAYKVNEHCRSLRLDIKGMLERGEYFSDPGDSLVYLADISYKKEAWFKKDLAYIETEWERLESMKRDHLEHYGEDKILVDNLSSDNPRKEDLSLKEMSRKDCYMNNFGVRIPFKYDFLSLVGSRKILEGEYALNKETNKVFLVKDDIIRMMKLGGLESEV